MKTLAFLISFLISFVVLLSCNKTPDQKQQVGGTDQSAVTRRLPANDAADYHNVPRAVSLASINNDIAKSNELLAQYEFQQKEADKQTGWQYFDDTYKSIKEKNAFLTQQFGYAILITKSLLGEESPAALEKIRYYTGELVSTKYAGYGALYFALTKLSAYLKYKSFTAEKAGEIAAYARQDAKAQHFLTIDIEKDVPAAQKPMAARNKFNAEFIPKIEAIAIIK